MRSWQGLNVKWALEAVHGFLYWQGVHFLQLQLFTFCKTKASDIMPDFSKTSINAFICQGWRKVATLQRWNSAAWGRLWERWAVLWSLSRFILQRGDNFYFSLLLHKTNELIRNIQVCFCSTPLCNASFIFGNPFSMIVTVCLLVVYERLSWFGNKQLAKSLWNTVFFVVMQLALKVTHQCPD